MKYQECILRLSKKLHAETKEHRNFGSFKISLKFDMINSWRVSNCLFNWKIAEGIEIYRGVPNIMDPVGNMNASLTTV